MFKEKNLSPKQLALLTALLMSSLIAMSVFVLIANWKLLLAYFIACFIVTYLLVYQILELFIYRKIKLIYKLISYTKASKREEAYQKYILPQKGMDGSQITGASSSYARKYALNGMFAIDDTKDSDATNDGKEDDGKPWLNKNTPQFDAAYKYVQDGGKITDIEKKYKLSKEIKEQLNTKP